MVANIVKHSSKSHIKVDDIKRALQSGDTDKAILLSQQALNNQDNAQEKIISNDLDNNLYKTLNVIDRAPLFL